MKYVISFQDVDKNSIPLVGGKNASLGEMIRAGIRVPPGFAVTTESYLAFITDANLKDRIAVFLDGLDANDVGAVTRASEGIQALITGASLSPDLQEAVGRAYSELCNRCGVDSLPVAVRSSATAEDLPSASFAGQQDTYLWIRGPDQVIQKVRNCWASLFTPRAISYRIKNRFPHEKVLISVGVQKMVKSRTAGVMFTLNPTDGDLSKVVIEGSWGLGETVVSGSVNPDKFIVDKVVMETTDRTVSAKHIECVFDPAAGEVRYSDVDLDRQRVCCLEDKELKELALLGKHIETHYGRPMDIEWAIDTDLFFPENIFIVQARPETVWTQRAPKSTLGGKTGFELLMEQAMKIIRIGGDG